MSDCNEWMDIETAPEDGTEILVYARWDWDAMGNPSEGYHIALARYEPYGIAGFWTYAFNPYSDIAVEPTHWMPLPKPPKE